MTVHELNDRTLSARQSKLVVDLATEALRSGDSREAERLLRGHLVKSPNDAGVLTYLAKIVEDQGRVEESTLLLRRAADCEQTPARFLSLLHHLKRYAGAEAILAEIEVLPPGIRELFDVRVLEAAALGTLGIHDREIEIYEKLTAVEPSNGSLWKTLGDALKTVGRLDDGVAALRRAIAARPTYGEAYWTLANFKSFRFTNEDIAAMRSALKKRLSEIDALHFHFALGQALEDARNYPQSFRHYSAGNRVRAARLQPSDMGITPFVQRAIARQTSEFFEQRAGAGCDGADPIFVVGLHRSGSTLIEQILASHPMIEGTTEITVISQLWNRLTRAAAVNGRGAFEELALQDASALEALGREYISRTKAFRLTERPYFVDKLPANWMHLGLIRLILPNAKIIDARRHPLACGFSNFKQHYASGMHFAYSQESIGTFYRDYWRYMSHLNRVQPGAVHRVINEKLIEDPEGEIRRMLDFIGVPFDPACLQFHQNKRAVRTPSAEQVRRPINREGVDRWRNYERWLGPLKEALGPALEQWDQ